MAKHTDVDPAVQQFVERFAVELAEMGVPRMPARVFACLLASETGRLTAGDLARRLMVSAAAISGAVRYLIQVGMIVRERTPGARVDQYAVRGDVWSDIYLGRLAALQKVEDVLAEGQQLLGPQHPAAVERIQHTLDFFEFIRLEMPKLMQRFKDRGTS